MRTPNPNPKVSIRLITFNHERYIAQAIESVLMQQTDFDYELVIGEDSSTDNTKSIVLGYQREHPERIRVLASEKNLGARANGKRTLAACRGEYVALLEGDDYWTHPYKLQEQVAWMDRNAACSFCAHSVLCYNENIKQFRPWPSEAEIPAELDIVHLIERNPIPTASVLFRRQLIPGFPPWYDDLKMGDWPLYLMLATKGYGRFVPDRWAVYRIHDQGVWTGASETYRAKASVEMLRQMAEYLGPAYRRPFRRSISNRAYLLALSHEKDGHFAQARHQAFLAIISALRGGQWPKKRYFGQLIRVTIPWMWRLLCRLRGSGPPRGGEGSP